MMLFDREVSFTHCGAWAQSLSSVGSTLTDNAGIFSTVLENEDSQGVAARLEAVKSKIAAAAKDASRDPNAVTLVAVSKIHGPEAVEKALEAGHRTFGENRVQEAEGKFPSLKAQYPDLCLHLIGPLQTNKARLAVELFDVIESIDRAKLAKAVAKEMEHTGRKPACFIQVNTGEEPQKAGVFPEEADALIALARDELGLPVEGLMCIPPHGEAAAPHFALLDEIAKRNNLTKLSMGMSRDFELAVRYGATHVRVGTAIFGERPRRD